MAASLAEDILKCIFLNENYRILIQISPKFLPRSPIDNKPALVQVMAWSRTGDKPLPEPMLTQCTEIYVALGGDELNLSNHFGLVTSYGTRDFCLYWFRYRLALIRPPSHYLNQWWITFHWTIETNFSGILIKCISLLQIKSILKSCLQNVSHFLRPPSINISSFVVPEISAYSYHQMSCDSCIIYAINSSSIVKILSLTGMQQMTYSFDIFAHMVSAYEQHQVNFIWSIWYMCFVDGFCFAYLFCHQ